jgi:hypothetical protein
LDFVREGLEGTALVGSRVGPVLFKLDDRLEAEGGGSDLRLEDPNEVGGGGFREVDDNRLRGDGSVYLLTDLFGKGGAGEALF